MKRRIGIAIMTMFAIATYAAPVELVIRADGDSDLLVPVSVSYIPAVDAVVDDAETEDVDESADAVAAQVLVKSTYRLGYKSTFVDYEIADGVRIVIQSMSSPKFGVDTYMSVAAFQTYYGESSAQLFTVLEQVGQIVPTGAFVDQIRATAAELLSAGVTP